MLGLTLAEPRFRPPSPPPTSPPRRTTSPLRSWLSSWRWTYTLLVLLIWCSTATANVGLVYAHTATANVGNQRPTYAYTAAPIFVLNSAFDAWQSICPLRHSLMATIEYALYHSTSVGDLW